jgi:hypothetical protein
MVPAGLTLSALLGDAATVVTEFDGLILLVAGLAIGIWGVRFLIGMIRSAR